MTPPPDSEARLRAVRDAADALRAEAYASAFRAHIQASLVLAAIILVATIGAIIYLH